MPQPVHPAKDGRCVFHAKGAHAYDGNVKDVHDPLNGEIGQKEAWDGYEGIRNKCRGAIKWRATLDGGLNAGRKRQTPHNERGTDEERERVEKPAPDFRQDRLTVLKRFQLAGCQVTQPIGVLQIERFIQMERGANARNVLRLHARIGRVYFTGFTRSKVDDREGDHRNND